MSYDRPCPDLVNKGYVVGVPPNLRAQLWIPPLQVNSQERSCWHSFHRAVSLRAIDSNRRCTRLTTQTLQIRQSLPLHPPLLHRPIHDIPAPVELSPSGQFGQLCAACQYSETKIHYPGERWACVRVQVSHSHLPRHRTRP